MRALWGLLGALAMAVAWSAAPLRADPPRITEPDDIIETTEKPPSCSESLQTMLPGLLKEHSPNRLTDVEEAQALAAGLKVCSACEQKRFFGNGSSLESFYNQITPVLQFLHLGQWSSSQQAYLKRAGKAQARNALSKYDELKELKKDAKKNHLESQTPPLACFKKVIEVNYHTSAYRHRLCKGKGSTREKTNVLKGLAQPCLSPALDEYSGVVASVFHNISDCMGLKERDRKVLFSVFAHESGFNNMARSKAWKSAALCVGQITAGPIIDINKEGVFKGWDITNNPHCKKVAYHFQQINPAYVRHEEKDVSYVPMNQECTLTQNPVSCMVYAMRYAKQHVLKPTQNYPKDRAGEGGRLAFYHDVIAYNAGSGAAQKIRRFISNYKPMTPFSDEHFQNDLKTFLKNKMGYKDTRAKEVAGYPKKVWDKLPENLDEC